MKKGKKRKRSVTARMCERRGWQDAGGGKEMSV